MIAQPFELAGERVLLDARGVLYWPAARLLAVADLHLEKGSAMARRGGLVPPWDSRITLDRLWHCIADFQPAIVVALGDSFEDRHASVRLGAPEAERIARLCALTRLIWVLGNHDPQAPAGLPGEYGLEFAFGPLRFRHQAAHGLAPGEAELCGHHHPKARVATRGGRVSRPCFVADSRRIILPAFGAYTGGLDVRSPAIAGLFPRGASLFLLGRERLFRFALDGVAENPGSAGKLMSEPAG